MLRAVDEIGHDNSSEVVTESDLKLSDPEMGQTFPKENTTVIAKFLNENMTEGEDKAPAQELYENMIKEQSTISNFPKFLEDENYKALVSEIWVTILLV